MEQGSQASFAFDELAASYDGSFSATVLGRRLRERVWRHLDRTFEPGERVLDVGCGTGEDALHLASRGVHVAATDASPQMAERAARKAEEAGLQNLVEVHTLPAEDLQETFSGQRFDGVLSNFGVLNCVEDLRGLGHQLGTLTRPHGCAFLCVMGPIVPWEWLWYLLDADPEKAFRRLRPGGAEWRGMRIRYPTIGTVSEAFASAFRSVGARALGAVLPPPFAESWAQQNPGLVERLADLEERLESLWPLPWLADHYLIELVRR